MNLKEYKISGLIFTATLLFIALVYHFFDKFTDLTAYVDAFTTALFFVGMWLMAKRKIEKGEITEDDASKLIGQKLFDRYVAPVIGPAPVVEKPISYSQYYEQFKD